MNLRSHHKRLVVCAKWRRELARMNGYEPEDVRYRMRGSSGVSFVIREEVRTNAQRAVAAAVLHTRPGLDPQRIAEMVVAIWRAHD